MKTQVSFGESHLPRYPLGPLDRVLSLGARHSSVLLLLAVCFSVSVIGVLVIRDLRAANQNSEKIYSSSVRGLQRIGELQFDAQETRRATLYALTTTDSNLQIDYADQTREADRRVRDGIDDYARNATLPEEKALADRLGRDWTAYLAVRDDVLASILEGSTQEAVHRDLAGGVPAFELVRQDLKEVKRLYGDEASRSQENLEASSRRSATRLAGILSFTFLLSTAAVWAIQRSQMLSRMQLARLQMEFVASVSHELRTPLAVIRSAADNIADGIVHTPEALVRYGNVLRHQSHSMTELVDQILLFASTEDRTQRLPLNPIELDRIIQAVLAHAHVLERDAAFELEIDFAPDLPPVLGDLTGITQILNNIVGNAIKYGGERGPIALRAIVTPPTSSSPGEMRISVSDHGIGIDPSEIPRIFEPFYRSPRVHAEQIHGTGLGLAVAKRLAESMGGRLSVLSQLHRGSTFTLHLQLAKGADAPIATTALPQSRLTHS